MALNRTELTEGACTKIYQTADGEKCKKADQLISIEKIRVPGVATKQRRVHQAVLTVQPYWLRHILAVAIKETLRK